MDAIWVGFLCRLSSLLTSLHKVPTYTVILLRFVDWVFLDQAQIVPWVFLLDLRDLVLELLLHRNITKVSHLWSYTLSSVIDGCVDLVVLVPLLPLVDCHNQLAPHEHDLLLSTLSVLSWLSLLHSVVWVLAWCLHLVLLVVRDVTTEWLLVTPNTIIMVRIIKHIFTYHDIIFVLLLPLS